MTTINISPKKSFIQISYPKDYSKKLAEKIGNYLTLGMPEESKGYEEDRIGKKAFLELVEEIEKERDKMLWKEFGNFQKQNSALFVFVYDSLDRLQHFFSGKETEKYYTQKDKLLGKILSKVDKKTLLLIASDHGFSEFKKQANINTFLEQNKFLKLKEKPPRKLFRDVDWENTRAYSIGFNSVFIVDKNKEKIIREIIPKLKNLKDGKNKVINKLYRKQDIYTGNLEDAPDIILGFNKGYRMSWESAIGGFSSDIIEKNTNKWKYDHLIDPEFVPGVFFSNIKLKKPEKQEDITPTILQTLNINIPEQIDGKSLLI